MSLDSNTLWKIKQQLHSGSGQSGVQADLYSHLTEVFSRIIQYHQYDAYDKFEEISTLVKKTHMSFADPKSDVELNQQSRNANAAAIARNEWIEQSRDLLNEVHRQMSRQKLQKLDCLMPNLEEEADMLEWAGISFGQDFTYKLAKSMKRLAVMSGATSLRFCGKVFGTQKDYWIVSGTLNHVEERQPSSVEPRGQGTNAQVFWVTDNILNDWIQLPECKPEYVCFSRMIKHVLTGDLNAQIDSNPPFPGKERHFLRAQLARIFAATMISPKGLYEIDEETNQMKMAEGFEWKSAEELNNLEEWGNTNAAITNGGRTTHVAPDGLDDEAKEAYLAEQGEKDPLLERFRGINEHTPMPGLEFSWVKKIVGDTQQYNQPGDKGPVSYCVNVLKSLRWPGAYTVHKQGKFCSIYVGYGLKHGDASMNPTEPPEVQRDPEDQEEMPEPTPLVAPQEPPEPDTDAVEKEDEEDE